MKKHWYKILAVLLLGYSLIMGLTTPVGPGVAMVEPAIVENPTTFEIDITGYNTNFSEANPTKVWLKYGKFYLCANEISFVSADKLRAKFSLKGALPDTLRGKPFHVVLQNAKDGLFLGVSMVTIKGVDTTTINSGKVALSCQEPKEKADASYFSFPYRGILHETIRNLNYHVPMWFTMISLLMASFIYSIMYLRTLKPDYDNKAGQLANVGVLFGILGIATGAFWARFTWGAFWSPDPKLNGAAIGVLIYIAYNILRSTIEDQSKVGRLAAVYNIMAFPIFIVLIIVLPKVADFSLHPGSGDSVGFNTYDLDNNLRRVFYPAVAGWILLGFWIAQLGWRIRRIEEG